MLFVAKAVILMHLIVNFYSRGRRLTLLLHWILQIGIYCFLILLLFKNGWQRFDVSFFQPLSPDEVTLFKCIFFTLQPPCTLFKHLLYKHVIVSTSNVVLVSTKSLICLYILICNAISFVDAVIQSSEHFLSDSRKEILLLY